MTNINNHQTFRLNGKHKETMESLVEQGFFPNKTDVIRSGILELGVKYGVIGNGNNGDTVKFKEGKPANFNQFAGNGGKRRKQ